MSRIAPWRIAPAAALGAILALGGCASEVDDPEDSSSILVIDAIEPSVVESDIAKVVEPLSAEVVLVKVRSIPPATRPGQTSTTWSSSAIRLSTIRRFRPAEHP